MSEISQSAAKARSVMAELRKATSDLHDKIDSDPRMSEYLQSTEGLARLLGRWYGFLRPYEQALSAAASSDKWTLFLSARRKTHLIVSDLKTFGVSVENLPCCSALPDLQNEAQMFGSMYVTEGSTLGGRYIARQIEKTLGLIGNKGYSFFNGYGENTQLRWKEFGRVVEDRCLEDCQEAMKAAVTTFECIHRWLVAG